MYVYWSIRLCQRSRKIHCRLSHSLISIPSGCWWNWLRNLHSQLHFLFERTWPNLYMHTNILNCIPLIPQMLSERNVKLILVRLLQCKLISKITREFTNTIARNARTERLFGYLLRLIDRSFVEDPKSQQVDCLLARISCVWMVASVLHTSTTKKRSTFLAASARATHRNHQPLHDHYAKLHNSCGPFMSLSSFKRPSAVHRTFARSFAAARKRVFPHM